MREFLKDKEVLVIEWLEKNVFPSGEMNHNKEKSKYIQDEQNMIMGMVKAMAETYIFIIDYPNVKIDCV